jgi:hypothetical protein
MGRPGRPLGSAAATRWRRAAWLSAGTYEDGREAPALFVRAAAVSAAAQSSSARRLQSLQSEPLLSWFPRTRPRATLVFCRRIDPLRALAADAARPGPPSDTQTARARRTATASSACRRSTYAATPSSTCACPTRCAPRSPRPLPLLEGLGPRAGRPAVRPRPWLRRRGRASGPGPALAAALRRPLSCRRALTPPAQVVDKVKEEQLTRKGGLGAGGSNGWQTERHRNSRGERAPRRRRASGAARCPASQTGGVGHARRAPPPNPLAPQPASQAGAGAAAAAEAGRSAAETAAGTAAAGATAAGAGATAAGAAAAAAGEVRLLGRGVAGAALMAFCHGCRDGGRPAQAAGLAHPPFRMRQAALPPAYAEHHPPRCIHAAGRGRT